MNMEKRKALVSHADNDFFNFVQETVDSMRRMR